MFTAYGYFPQLCVHHHDGGFDVRPRRDVHRAVSVNNVNRRHTTSNPGTRVFVCLFHIKPRYTCLCMLIPHQTQVHVSLYAY